MQLDQLQEILDKNEQAPFRMKQILKHYFSHDIKTWDDIPNIPKTLIESLNNELALTTVKIVEDNESDEVIKFVFEILDGGHKVEAVVMKHFSGRRTLCISCQSGCAMGCLFCATGTLGLQKNLTSGEIIDIAREVQLYLKTPGKQFSNVVYMGMGEPFNNYEAVKKSITILHEYFGIGWRKISISTCGIIPKIMEFAHDLPQVNLAISLHAANDQKRSQLMQVNNAFPIKDLIKECKKYVRETNRKIFFEYLLINEYNDTKKDAAELAKLLDNPLFHINVIQFHANEAVENSYGVDWREPTQERLQKFLNYLEAHNLLFTLRKSHGKRLDAACGMLALKKNK